MVAKQGMEQIGRYQVLRRLGRGGMGFVYKALVPVIDKVVAVKVLQPFETMEVLLGYERLKEIFTFEAVTMAGLHHPALVDVWDYAEDSRGRPFFVMEYFCNNLGRMIGEDFQLLKKSRMVRADKVLAYGRQLLQGLLQQLGYIIQLPVYRLFYPFHNLLLASYPLLRNRMQFLYL